MASSFGYLLLRLPPLRDFSQICRYLALLRKSQQQDWGWGPEEGGADEGESLGGAANGQAVAGTQAW
jgi:hypothetical protein